MMNNFRLMRTGLRPGAACLTLALCFVLAAGCRKAAIIEADLSDFQQVNLVANKAIYNPDLVDPTLDRKSVV